MKLIDKLETLLKAVKDHVCKNEECVQYNKNGQWNLKKKGVLEEAEKSEGNSVA